MSLENSLQPLQASWQRLTPKDKNWVRLALVLVLSLLIWQFSLKPALATVRTAEAQSRLLEAQLQQIRAAQAQAQTLQKQPALHFEEAARTLTTTTQQTLGATAQLTMVGEGASVTLKAATPDALAEWLRQARLNARSVPLEAKLVQNTTATGSTAITWSGVVVMSLPAR